MRALLEDYMSRATVQNTYSGSHTVTGLAAGVTGIDLLEQPMFIKTNWL